MTVSLDELVQSGKNRSVKPGPGVPKHDTASAWVDKHLRRMRNTDDMSEYQTAYRRFPFQSPRNCIRPVCNKMDFGKSSAPKTTTYKTDYVFYEDKNAIKMQNCKPIQTYRRFPVKVSDQTIYKLAYQNLGKDVAKLCHPFKPKKVPQVALQTPCGCCDAESAKESLKAEVVSIPEVEQSPPVKGKIIEPVVEKNKVVPVQSVMPCKKTRFVPFNGVTTSAADYVKFPYAPRRPLIKPHSSEKPYDLGPFDGRTTQNLAYKPWPVFPLERPPWAVKPVYKRPPYGGMPYSSTYTSDFEHPQYIVERVMLIKPDAGSDIIKHTGENGEQQSCTTYQGHYLAWDGVLPSKSCQMKQVYVPPEAPMDTQSTQKSHFKGAQAERPSQCRRTSEHRMMDRNKEMYFNTSYKDDFQYRGRPVSCPSTV